jgi:hypothetical protein
MIVIEEFILGFGYEYHTLEIGGFGLCYRVLLFILVYYGLIKIFYFGI